MNQILYTGGKKKKGVMSDTQKIVLFFVIGIIIFAICVIGIGVNLLSKVKSENVANTNTENTNTNTNTNTPEETPTVQDYIKIEFKSELGKVKILLESLTDAKIQTMSYWWDDQEEKTTLEIADTKYETLVASKTGTHYLYVEATDENGNKKDRKQMVIGDAGPEVTIGTDGVSKYVVKVSDDEKIEKIEVKLNGELTEIEVNAKEYEYTVDIPQGYSLIEVTAYNLNGISTNKKAKIGNFGG